MNLLTFGLKHRWRDIDINLDSKDGKDSEDSKSRELKVLLLIQGSQMA